MPYETFWSAIVDIDKTQRKEKGDHGTSINDPAFRVLLRHQGAPNVIPPEMPWVLRIFPIDGFSTERCGDAGQILKEYLLGSGKEGDLLKQVQEKGVADETLTGLAHDSGITPSYLWDVLPDEYKKSVKGDDDLGDGAEQFYMTTAGIGHSYTGYVEALKSAAEKGEIATDFTSLTGFAKYIGLHGCPVYHDTDRVVLDNNNFRNLLGWATHLLSKDKKLMREGHFKKCST